MLLWQDKVKMTFPVGFEDFGILAVLVLKQLEF